MVWLHSFISAAADSRKADVSYWQKYVHIVLVNCIEGLSLPLKSVVRLTDPLDMTIAVYHMNFVIHTHMLQNTYL